MEQEAKREENKLYPQFPNPVVKACGERYHQTTMEKVGGRCMPHVIEELFQHRLRGIVLGSVETIQSPQPGLPCPILKTDKRNRRYGS